jgi:phage-related protein
MGLGDRWGILKNKVFVALQPIATKLFKKIESFVIKITPKVQKLAERFEEWLDSEQFDRFKESVTEALGKVKDAIVLVTEAVGGWIKQNPKAFLVGLATVIGVALVLAVWALVSAIAALFTPVTLIVTAIALLAAGAVYAYQQFDWFRGIVDGVVDVFQNLWDIVKGFAEFWWKLVHGDLSGAIEALSDMFGSVLERIIGWFSDAPGDIVDNLAAGLWQFVSWGADVTTKITDGIGDIAGKIKQKIMDLGGSMFAIGTKMKTWGTDLGKALINGLIEMWNKADLRFPRVEVPSWVPKIGGKGFGGFDVFPDIPHLAAGGLITGPQVLLAGEAGPELIIPLDRAGEFGGSTHITINMPAGADGAEVLAAIERETRWRGAAAFPVNTNRRL